LITGQLSFVIFGGAFGATLASRKGARSATIDDKRQLTSDQ
jgi:hypothetical protein